MSLFHQLSIHDIYNIWMIGGFALLLIVGSLLMTNDRPDNDDHFHG